MGPLKERTRELEREMAEINAAERAYVGLSQAQFMQERQHERRQEHLEEIEKELAAWLRRPAG